MIHKDTFLLRCLRAGVCLFGLVILSAIACTAEAVEEKKTFSRTETENGVAIRIVRFCNGEDQVLMDCEYDTVQFPYYFEKYTTHGSDEDVFNQFYMDNPVWEKTIYVENLNEAYTLYYAQNKQYDSEDKEKTTGYEGHLWVLDEKTRIVKRLFWQSAAPYKKITWKSSTLFIQYADGSKRTCGLSEILQDPAEAVCEKCMQIDFGVEEDPIDTEKYDAVTDQVYKDAYYGAVSGQARVRTAEKEYVYLKDYWCYQGGALMEDEAFLENLINNTRFYYMDFDGDGLPELVMDIIGDGLHILKYLPDEKIVELFFGYERMPYYHLLGSGQLYYENGMLANKLMLRYDTVDAYGQVRRIVSFMEDADYKPHKEDEEIWWDMSYWVYLDEELGMVQIDENRYREITEDFLNAVEHAVPVNTFEEIFGERMKERTGTRKW
ncbi:MAG: hypothetical protein K2N39_04265 [Lachnospiraceae bacterium]|nr:hypothetical protein [Lachnospiraceae bacterium]